MAHGGDGLDELLRLPVASEGGALAFEDAVRRSLVALGDHAAVLGSRHVVDGLAPSGHVYGLDPAYPGRVVYAVPLGFDMAPCGCLCGVGRAGGGPEGAVVAAAVADAVLQSLAGEAGARGGVVALGKLVDAGKGVPGSGKERPVLAESAEIFGAAQRIGKRPVVGFGGRLGLLCNGEVACVDLVDLARELGEGSVVVAVRGILPGRPDELVDERGFAFVGAMGAEPVKGGHVARGRVDARVSAVVGPDFLESAGPLFRSDHVVDGRFLLFRA